MRKKFQSAIKLWLIALVGIGLWATTATAQAALIHAQGQVWSLNTDAPVRHYFSTPRASDGNTGTLWVTDAAVPDYFGPYGPPILTMDLGADVAMNGLAFWNYSTSNANDTSAFSLRFATSAEGPLGMSQSIAYNPSFNPAYGGPAVQENLPFAQQVTARYVEMTVTDNYRGLSPSKPGGDRVGFADVQFDVAAAPAYQASATMARPTATENASNPSVIIDGNAGTQWYTNAYFPEFFSGATDSVLVIDLGGQRTIDGFDFRNYSIAGNRTKDFSLQFATEGEGPGGFGSSISYQPSFTVANQDQNQNQSLDFSQAVSARFVQMTITDNYYGAGAGGDRVGFAEIDFRDAQPGFDFADIVTPVAATSSTASSDYFPVANLIDGNSGTTWVSSGEGDYYTNRHTPILTFDLGQDSGLTGIQFENYPVPGNAAKDFALAFASEADGPDGFGTSIDYFPIFHPLVEDGITQQFSFDQIASARYVQMLMLDNYAGWGYPGGDRVGFAEVAFSVVPEPSTLAMASLSACLLGLMLFRRRKRG